MYEILKKKYKLGYVRKDQLQRYLALGKLTRGRISGHHPVLTKTKPEFPHNWNFRFFIFPFLLVCRR